MKEGKNIDILLSRMEEAYQKLGSEVHLRKKAPADKEAVTALEERLNCKIPSAMEDFFVNFSADLLFSAKLPENFSLPEGLKSIFCAYFHISLEEVFEAEMSRREWVKECFPDEDDAYDKVWHNK